jgi:hypothetical protein
MILLFTLVALVVLLVGGITLVRAMDSALLQAGNLAFKRDLVNESERAMARALSALNTGALSTDAARQANLLTSNYSASRLATTNAYGLPDALLSANNWTAAGFASPNTNDISDNGITLRFVIDRQCNGAGDITTVSCSTVIGTPDNAADDRYRQVNDEARPVYRISVLATGPRNTRAYFQTTVVR